MGGVKVGLIRVLTVTDPAEYDSQAKLLRGCYPQLDVVTKILEGQPRGVYDDESLKEAEPKVVRAAEELDAAGVAVIVVSCAEDPGVELAKRRIGVPVIGAGTAGALVARAYSRPVGVLTLNGTVSPPVRDILGGLITGVARPEGVQTALDLRTPGGMRGIEAAGARLKDLGCKVVLLGCTGMTALGVSAKLTKDLGLPVVDPLMSAGAIAALMASMQPGVSAREP